MVNGVQLLNQRGHQINWMTSGEKVNVPLANQQYEKQFQNFILFVTVSLQKSEFIWFRMYFVFNSA